MTELPEQKRQADESDRPLPLTLPRTMKISLHIETRPAFLGTFLIAIGAGLLVGFCLIAFAIDLSPAVLDQRTDACGPLSLPPLPIAGATLEQMIGDDDPIPDTH